MLTYALQLTSTSVHLNFNLYMLFARAQSLQSCLTLCDPMDHCLPDSSVHGIFQLRILEWVATPSFRGSSLPRDWTHISCIAGRFFTYMLSSVILLCFTWDLCFCTVTYTMSLGNFISHTTFFPLRRITVLCCQLNNLYICLLVFFLLFSNSSWLKLNLDILLDYFKKKSSS